MYSKGHQRVATVSASSKTSVEHSSVIVWGYISASVDGDLNKTDSVMNTEKYCQALIHHALHGKHLIGNSLIFQDDNDPCQ